MLLLMTPNLYLYFITPLSAKLWLVTATSNKQHVPFQFCQYLHHDALGCTLSTLAIYCIVSGLLKSKA